MTKALIILGKYPHPGKVKTRLAKDLGHDLTVSLYKNFLEKLFTQVQLLKDVDVFICYGDPADKKHFQEWLGNKFSFLSSSQDIEQNLKNAFSTLFDQGFTKIVSIASDVPDLDSKLIETAFDELNNYNVVIGPDKGGGIYLYGVKKHYPEVFENNNRSPSSIFAETKQKLLDKKLKLSILDQLIDIDTIEDLNQWKKLKIDY